jgi:hypothetical protein
VFLARGQDGPCDRNGTATIEDTQRQHHKALPQRSRIQGQGHLVPFQPTQDPLQQGGKTRLADHLLAMFPPFGRGFVAEFPQLLAHGVGFAVQPLREQGADRAERTGSRHDHPQAPQGQDGRWGLAQLRKVRGDNARPLIHWLVARHGLPPTSWSVWQYPSMPDRRPVLPSPLPACLLALTQKPTSKSGKGGVNGTMLKNKTNPEGLILLPTSC